MENTDFGRVVKMEEKLFFVSQYMKKLVLRNLKADGVFWEIIQKVMGLEYLYLR